MSLTIDPETPTFERDALMRAVQSALDYDKDSACYDGNAACFSVLTIKHCDTTHNTFFLEATSTSGCKLLSPKFSLSTICEASDGSSNITRKAHFRLFDNRDDIALLNNSVFDTLPNLVKHFRSNVATLLNKDEKDVISNDDITFMETVWFFYCCDFLNSN